ncbi:MAG: bifunctional phosphopantothenoylcysteine decarboxylase/phosphopantothenate--cysteine ligase CoaBC [Sulfolobales archaeon]|nr:bifunctional phosphopantothenoylcysteine decarboxylase/phosphopantothenate--cysteine ligase CoaBC [Sulfolobales archaeon]MCX8208283.1 bifunctional phosphopantothenoylcysteine decarboxylase/phosphopantothenate--cysteine ligase CoaBC [Sulfolobales archaeon]MDW8010125.1 bifunctional phosphopantothenoylcysteine decarboxylase/phosphopantothenate--cysteine ligase CoaBC [Sulfolobales archaeon]
MKVLRWHPVDEIRGKLSKVLLGKSIALGVTSSVSLYRSVDLARELIRLGADVHVVMSPEAAKYVTPRLFEWATGNKVFVSFSGEVGHIALAEICDGFVIAPATANTIAKIALGISDTSVTVLAQSFLGMGKPLVVVPAAHYSLLTSPPISDATKKLEELGVTIVPPVVEERRAKYPPVEDIVSAVEASILRGRDLRGLKLLVTAGPTREYLDSVRFLTNSSSGKMGVAIAREAYFRGAEVALVHGPLTTAVPHYVRSVSVRTTEDMLEEVLSEVSTRKYDAVVLAAAPVDFKFSSEVVGKISSEIERIEVVMTPTPKISLGLRKVFSGLVVGFAAEFAGGSIDELTSKAREKLGKRGFNIVVANDISRADIGFSSEYNEVVILTDRGDSVVVSRARKVEVARVILDQLLRYLKLSEGPG